MHNKKTLAFAGALSALLFAGVTSVGATPAGTALDGLKKAAPTQVDTVHWRRWRHCHRRWGWRCRGYRYYGYGYRYYGYPYYYRPGLVFGFGGFRHHHHHWH
jgi:hypothetical protein